MLTAWALGSTNLYSEPAVTLKSFQLITAEGWVWEMFSELPTAPSTPGPENVTPTGAVATLPGVCALACSRAARTVSKAEM